MGNITFYGGVGEIGGNIILLETEESRILFDFGKSFSEESEYFSEFLRPRKSHGLADFIELGFLPDLDGVYRKDYMNHLERDVQEETSIDALFLTHAHMDHVGYVHFLRPDIPIYCTDTTEVLMGVLQESGNFTFQEFKEKKKEFYLREKSNGGLTRLSKRDGNYDSVDIEPMEQRDIRVLEDEESVEVGDTRVELIRVNHSLPGAAGFHIETPDNRLVYTGDLRLHGYKSHRTQNFIERSRNFEPDYLITEGTNVGENDIPTEEEVKQNLQEYIGQEDNSAFINFPALDLERLQSAVVAAQEEDRTMVIRTKQAILLQELENEGILPSDELSLSNSNIQVLAPQKGWGSLTHSFRMPDGSWQQLDGNVSEEVKKSLAKRDYHTWERDLVFSTDSVTPYDINDNLGEYIVYADYYRLKDLVDFDPEAGSYLWSRTEPFNQSMMLDQKRVHNWLDHFNLDMRKAHASGHISQNELKNMIQEISPDTLLPIHTEQPEWFRRLAFNQKTIREGKLIEI